MAAAAPDDRRWNHNIHYHPVVLRAIPLGCHNALDVGCGDGMLARRLRAAGPHVIALDVDEPTLTRARADDGRRRCRALDLPYEIAGVVAHRFHVLTKVRWKHKSHCEHSSPTVWPPPETYAGMRRIARETLPGARFRRRSLWRYSVVWTKPRPPRSDRQQVVGGT